MFQFCPERKFRLRVFGGLMAMAVIGSACGGSGDSSADSEAALPGTGVTVTMARANWETGYFQAEIFRQLVGELGYTVNDPADNELDPATFYPALAAGDIDFWVNGWFPNHDPHLASEFGDGSTIGDHVVAVGIEIAGGGLQGVLVDSKTAEAASITWLGDIGNSPEIAALFDTDGDGLANLAGCNDGWGCQIQLDELIAEQGWSDTIEQDSGVYDDQWADAITRLSAGEPVVAYTWTPSGYLGEMTPGDGAIWLSIAFDDDEAQAGVALPPRECPGQPCNLGFDVADIRVVSNREFASANPVLVGLFEAVGFQLSDIVVQNFQMRQGEGAPEDVRRHASEWIERERRTVDAWLRHARSVAD